MLLLFGIPLLYMEMILGQWLHLDNIRIWKQLTPWLGGLGYTSIMVNEGPDQEASQPPLVVSKSPVSTLFAPQAHCVRPQVCILISVYNSIIMSWTFSYLGNSFYYPLPWNQCSMVKNTNATGEERERGGHQGQGRLGHRGTRDRAGEPKEGGESRGRLQVGRCLSAWVPQASPAFGLCPTSTSGTTPP